MENYSAHAELSLGQCLSKGECTALTDAHRHACERFRRPQWELQHSMQNFVWDNASQMLTDMCDQFCSPSDAPAGRQQPLASQL